MAKPGFKRKKTDAVDSDDVGDSKYADVSN